jgi:putative endonuclease
MGTDRTSTSGDAPQRPADARSGGGDASTTLRGAEAGRGDPRRRLGGLGERLAREHLEARGFEILDANFRTRLGELDVVARNDRFLVFCEVKTRIRKGERGVLGPFAAIGSRKRRRVRMMAREWLGARRITGPRPPEIRFDAIGVELAPSGRLVELEHLEDAF